MEKCCESCISWSFLEETDKGKLGQCALRTILEQVKNQPMDKYTLQSDTCIYHENIPCTQTGTP